ncbi:MAG: glutamine-hydrolyzing carbamoyl-phosphate synthase small subunit [Deltaproteobacteria bacterium]|nr:glutamine-hydrolyzing carbamoyl-phosphate synthase small subunit [Deltaproteobacteria bacterium]
MADRAQLVLEDGRIFAGESFGARVESVGEVVFNTAMSGYQEILTDPSYTGQMVCMTYPHIGNTGVNDEDIESRRVFAEGFIVRSRSLVSSNYRRTKTLEEYLEGAGIAGIAEVDTRALTRHLRTHGSRVGIIAPADRDPAKLIEKIRANPPIVGRDLVGEVTCDAAYPWTQSSWDLGAGYGEKPPAEAKYKVVAMDFGVKTNILRQLVDFGCAVTVVPATTSADAILAMEPDGVFLSNGPGDPEPVTYAIETIRALVGKKPIFGICLGHQLIGLALGARTYKLKFGHHGANQPVKDHATGRVEITSQNHNFAVDLDSIAGDVVATHVNLNDGTNEGMAHRTHPVFSVQYHPEASPGPHDASYLFDRFTTMMRTGRPVADEVRARIRTWAFD